MANNNNGSSGDTVMLKFIFANQDGIHKILSFHNTTNIAIVKMELIKNWPEGISPVVTPKAIRLICMGRGVLQDNQSILECKVPTFTTHPTPVNVAITRKTTVETQCTTVDRPCLQCVLL